jgi:dUTP pyrophosphatase
MKLQGVTIVNRDGEQVDLKYATKYSAGFDINASEQVIIYPRKKLLIPTGLYLKVDKEKINYFFCLDIRPRSGVSLNTDLVICNAPGTVDLDYEGEIQIIARSSSDKTMVINKGDPLAQGVFVLVLRPDCILVEDKERGEGGFGSTVEEKKAPPRKAPTKKKKKGIKRIPKK